MTIASKLLNFFFVLKLQNSKHCHNVCIPFQHYRFLCADTERDMLKMMASIVQAKVRDIFIVY